MAVAPVLDTPHLSSGEPWSSPLTISLRGHRLRVAPSQPLHAAYWRNVESGLWEDTTLRFVEAVTDKDTTFIDIGAWIGALSLLAGARAKRVISLEPDPVAQREFAANIALNAAPIELWRAGIDNGEGSLRLFAKAGFGDAMTSSLGDPSGEAITVTAVSFDDISAALRGSSGKVVLKMDVEGHEFKVGDQLVAFARKHGASLNVSLHAAILCRSFRRNSGPLGARMATFFATKKLLDGLASCGRVRLNKTGEPITLLRLFSFMFLRRRPKNFSVDVFPE
jgi:FkbM family methyltransferase